MSMTVFGLDERHVRGLVETVSPSGELDDSAIADRFARAAWSVLVEPGDATAGRLVAERGAADALRLVLRDGDRSGAQDAQGAGTGLPEEELTAAMERWRPRLRSGEVERALLLAARVAARLLVPPSEREPDLPWPSGTDDLGDHAPITLWARGDPERLRAGSAGIALVGARAATGYGEHVTGEVSAGLVGLELAVVSGAAYGIDGMAHRAALASGGLTVAFLAGGVDRFYPAGHDELLHRVSDRGLVVSELPCGAAPTRWRFLQRNRLIAACSAATVVVEAGARSGSLNTAGHAAALGRPLGAVPGPVTSPTSAGCHRLLREYDAVCVTNAAEAAELVRPWGGASESADEHAPTARDGAETVRVLDALSTRAPRTPADIASRAGLSLRSVLAVLAALEVEGRARGDAAGWQAVPRRGAESAARSA